jgi:hypothetical protein
MRLGLRRIAWSAARRGELGWLLLQGVEYPVVLAALRCNLDGLSNPDHGQWDAFWRLARTELFGASVFWDEITPGAIPPRSLFALHDDPRLTSTPPDTVWNGNRTGQQ